MPPGILFVFIKYSKQKKNNTCQIKKGLTKKIDTGLEIK